MRLNSPDLRALHNVGRQNGVHFPVTERFEVQVLARLSITGTWLLQAERGAWAHRDAPAAYR